MARIGRGRLLTAAASAAVHGAILALLVLARPDPAPPEPEAMSVALVTLAPPEPPPEPPKPPEPPRAEPEPAKAKPAPPKPAPVKAPPRRTLARAAPESPDVAPVLAFAGPPADGDSDVSDGELASATTARSGGGGGACNMPRWLEGKLRQDRRVQAAVAEVHRGRAIRVWNGDWVRHAGQEGAGLAAVREAIMWEVGFAPEACRREPVQGLVMIALGDAPGSPRIVVGQGRWRWSDLLFARGAGPRTGPPRG